jgi:hypothetical protein
MAARTTVNLRTSNINSNISFLGQFRGNVMQYADIARSYLDRDYAGARIFKTVFPSWDNTARTGERALIVQNGTPDNYEHWLSATIDRINRNSTDTPMLFINAWNEWAEGCHLEPDRRFGHGFLQATLNAKNGVRRFVDFPDVALPDAELAAHKTLWKDLRDVFGYHAALRLGRLKLQINRLPRLRAVLVRLVRLVRA